MIRGLFESETKFAKRIIKDCRCSIHNKKAKLTFDYDREENAIPIVNSCCKDFSKYVANILSEHFDHIIVY